MVQIATASYGFSRDGNYKPTFGVFTRRHAFHPQIVAKRRVADILAEQGIYKETPALKAAHQESLKRHYAGIQSAFAQQFRIKGKAFHSESRDGNDGDDLDKESNFPNKTFTSGGQAKTWLEIGASSWGADENFVGSFSNYGKKSVDLFAPGVQIYSTTPGDTYENLQGTSMAAPAASGVAAIIMSYFPDLDAAQVREILRQSTRKFDGLKVNKPGSEEEVPFSQLSSSGGMVNAYEAVKLAMSIKEGDRRKK